MSVVNILTGHDLFRLLPVEDIDAISRFSAVKHFDADAVPFRFNTAATHVFVLMEGEVLLTLPATPPELAIQVSTVAQGELFGLSPLLGAERYSLEARCRRPTAALAIEAKGFVELLHNRPLVGAQVMTRVARTYFERHIDTLKSLQRVVAQLPIFR